MSKLNIYSAIFSLKALAINPKIMYNLYGTFTK